MAGSVRAPAEQKAIGQLSRKELERRTIEAIREYQRRLNVVQALYRQQENDNGAGAESAVHAYIEAADSCDSQHMVVSMYIKLLGYVPEP